MDQKQHNLPPAQAGNGDNGEPQRPPNGEEPALAPAGRTGIIAWFVSNHVAANLLMLFIIVAGVITLLTMKAEVFQEIELDRINVTVPYPGATPAEVEEGIVQRVEEAIEGIRGIKRIRSIAVEGAGTVTAE